MQPLQLDYLGLNSSSATYYLCNYLSRIAYLEWYLLCRLVVAIKAQHCCNKTSAQSSLSLCHFIQILSLCCNVFTSSIYGWDSWRFVWVTFPRSHRFEILVPGFRFQAKPLLFQIPFIPFYLKCEVHKGRKIWLNTTKSTLKRTVSCP